MKTQNMIGNSGRAIANQFIITDGDKEVFQSYKSVIAIKQYGQKTIIGRAWDYSKTTGKYRNIFLGETKKETEAKIKSGEYVYNVELV